MSEDNSKERSREKALARIKTIRNEQPDLAHVASMLLQGDRNALSKALTLVESERSEDAEQTSQLLDMIGGINHLSHRVGITGVPGVGKSTLIEGLGMQLIAEGKKVAVLAIDPSSSFSKGSILGDKTRMEGLSREKNAFIRPSPSSDSPGGVARKTREAIALCEAAGYDTIIIETVGVGQGETAVRAMCDTFLLLMLAGAGDDLQGIKRGIMEMADIIAVTKAEGDNSEHAAVARATLAASIHMLAPEKDGWICPVITCSAVIPGGLIMVREELDKHWRHLNADNSLSELRKMQNLMWFKQSLHRLIIDDFRHSPQMREHVEQLEYQVISGKLSPFSAADSAISRYRETFSRK
jgi:LAO/AO transport system kinase